MAEKVILIEKIDPDALYCILCDDEIDEFYTTYFVYDGRRRYGAICINCRDRKAMQEAALKMKG